MKTWKENEIQFLLSNYSKMSLKDIAKKLGRSSESVHLKLRCLGIFYDARKIRKSK